MEFQAKQGEEIMKRYDLMIIGAGPAGLCAAIEAAKVGMSVVVFDENSKPGGQLFKQIHKFFGSKEHMASYRGFHIGEMLLNEAAEYHVEVILDSTVMGLYAQKEVTVKIGDEIKRYKGDAVIIATGASEKSVAFKGWTLPGVIGAGAAQTMMNQHHTKPGNKILMLGSGNVGVVVAYQLLQAGCEVLGVADALPKVGGYGVHAAKVARCGVPFFLKHTIIEAHGKEKVEGVTIAEIDSNWKTIPGTEKYLDVDTICLAVGLSPMIGLCQMAGCNMIFSATKGGVVPECDEHGETSVKGIYAAGDVSAIEEASSAMIEGRISGIAAAYQLGFLEKDAAQEKITQYRDLLYGMRQGMFKIENRGKNLKVTDENISLSKTLLEKGYLLEEELEKYPGYNKKEGIHPVIECTQNIPCNPCQEACPTGCIKVGEQITFLPSIEDKVKCIGCGMCVASCPGQAIFLVNINKENDLAEITLPYEFLPLPKVGDIGIGLDRSGTEVCKAKVVSIKTMERFDKTNLLTIQVQASMAYEVRFYKGE